MPTPATLGRWGLLLAPGLLFLPVTASAAEAGAASASAPDLTARMMLLAIQLGTLLFAARLGRMVFERWRLPGVLGEVAIGILIGPYALGGIPLAALGFPHGLFPPFQSSGEGTFAVTPELYGFCTVASILLLFMVGLETDLALFLRYSLPGALVGIGGVVASFLLGAAVGMLWLPRLTGEVYRVTSAPIIFMGVLSTATSVGITARILSEVRRLDSPEGVTILAAAVIDDVLGVILLATSLGVLGAGVKGGRASWGAIGELALKTFGIWLAATTIGLLASRRIGSLLKLFRDRMAIALMAFGLALIAAGIFEEAHLAMIIGAYVTGLSLSRTDISRLVVEQLHPVHALLVPVFFVVMGMLVDLRALLSWQVVGFGAVYTAGAILAKVIGCALPALGCGFNFRGALRIGVGMVPRGEVALLIAGIGVSAGYLSPQVFGVGVLMTMVTTLVAPAVLMRLFRSAAAGTRAAPAAAAPPPTIVEFPTPETAAWVAGRLLELLAAEGFFAHELDPGGGIYQLRKDDAVITFEQDGARLAFRHRPREAALIRTALLEVAADFERMLAQLRTPLESAALSRSLATAPADGRPLSLLPAVLRPSAMVPRLRATNRNDAIAELVETLAAAGFVRDAGDARRAVLEREAVMSTGLQHGVALPHGRTDAVTDIVCAVGLSPAGIDFGSLDRQPARIIVLTLAPRSIPAPHVQLLAEFGQRLDALGRVLLLSCETGAQMHEWLVTPPVAAPSPPREVLQLPAAVRWVRRLWRWLRPPPAALRPQAFVLDLDAGTPEAAIHQLVSRAAARRRDLPAEEIASAIVARERIAPTGLVRGIALPHARTDRVAEPWVALGLHPAGLDFGGEDRKPAHVLLLAALPRWRTDAVTLRRLAALVAQVDAIGLERWRAVRTAREIAMLLGD
ncbi:MAG: cation:proton antiporter [Kiritimatiellae bacterium]|nr:cation:proton antiporter [Kiritimatiellia bacterium]